MPTVQICIVGYLKNINRQAQGSKMGGIITLDVIRKDDVQSIPSPVDGTIYGAMRVSSVGPPAIKAPALKAKPDPLAKAQAKTPHSNFSFHSIARRFVTCFSKPRMAMSSLSSIGWLPDRQRYSAVLMRLLI
jgi:hypothetical protein